MASLKNFSPTRMASHFRAKNGFGTVDPINFVELLYSLDVITVFMKLSGGFSGMAQKNGDQRFMLINSKHSKGRQNFTICHELYHLYYQGNFTSVVCSTGKFDKKDKEEYKADCFAAELILPEFGILSELPPEESKFNGISLSTLLKIEHKFRCSRSALLYRLKIMGLIDSEHFDKFKDNVRQGANEYGYSQNIYEPSQIPLTVVGDYGDKARKKYESDQISESHFISLMQDIGIDLDETFSDYVDE